MTNSKKSIALMMAFLTLLTLTMIPPKVVETQDESLFEVTIIAPGNANMVRRQWGQIYANSLIQLGIDARVVYLGWAGVYDRVLDPLAELLGKTWDDGGFDILLVGQSPGTVPQPRLLYHSDNFPPGYNYYLWNSPEADLLLDTFISTTNLTERDQALKAFQSLVFTELPSSAIHYSSTPSIVNPNLGGTALADSPRGPGWVYFNVEPQPQLLVPASPSTEVVYASTGEISDLIPLFSSSWYDTIVISNIYNGLAQVSPATDDYSVPSLFTSWTPSENGFKWTYEVRTGVLWHDGEPFTADDAIFSLWAAMFHPKSVLAGVYAAKMGTKVTFTYSNGTSFTEGTGTREGNITAIDADTIEAWLPELIEGKAYGYVDPYILAAANNIIPKHIFEKIPIEQWENTPFQTGVGSITIDGTTYTGPVGTGPYKWVDYDATGQIIHLEKNDQYWNRTALEADGLFGVTDYYIRYIADKTPALAALKNGEVDILDPQYQLQADVATIDPSWGRVLIHTGTGHQEIGYNMEHPIFGTGVDTPLGQSDPSRAAEAARYVRTAFDYAVPRQLIIDNLMDGFGEPAATTHLPTHPHYNASVTARPYDLTKAAEYLALAGYSITVPTPPEIKYVVGMSLPISGIHTDDTGGLLPETELELRVTTDNVTFQTVGVTTTDYSGRYFFTVTPTEPGTYYYWSFDRLRVPVDEVYKGTYLQSLEVTTFEDTLSDVNTEVSNLSSQIANLTNIAYIGVIISIVAIALAFVLGRKK